MDWVKLSVRYYTDERVEALPDSDAELMFVRGLARAGEVRREGFIPADSLPKLARRRRYAASVDALLAAGLWTRVDGGFQVTNWDHWQDSLDALARRRTADRERQRRRRAATLEPTSGSSLSRDNEPPSRDMSRDVTHTEKEIEKERATTSAKPPPLDRPDVEKVCNHLVDRIVENGSRRPTVTDRWRTEARLLIDKDGKTVEQIINAINWCQSDEFWRANVMSMPKLREKYDQLRLAAQRNGGARASPPSTAPVAVPLEQRCPEHRGQPADSCRDCRARTLARPKDPR